MTDLRTLAEHATRDLGPWYDIEHVSRALGSVPDADAHSIATDAAFIASAVHAAQVARNLELVKDYTVNLKYDFIFGPN